MSNQSHLHFISFYSTFWNTENDNYFHEPWVSLMFSILSPWFVKVKHDLQTFLWVLHGSNIHPDLSWLSDKYLLFCNNNYFFMYFNSLETDHCSVWFQTYCIVDTIINGILRLLPPPPYTHTPVWPCDYLCCGLMTVLEADQLKCCKSAFALSHMTSILNNGAWGQD